MVAYTTSLKVGNPFTGDKHLGPIQNAMQYSKVQGFLADCTIHGQSVVTGGDKTKKGAGYFIPPTIIDNPPSDSKIVTEEPFGPIIPVQPWSSEEDVIRRANDTKTGLGATIWAKDLERAERIARSLEVGSVYVNCPLRPDPRVYFSGHKESGFRGENAVLGLLAYCNAQAVHIYE